MAVSGFQVQPTVTYTFDIQTGESYPPLVVADVVHTRGVFYEILCEGGEFRWILLREGVVQQLGKISIV